MDKTTTPDPQGETPNGSDPKTETVTTVTDATSGTTTETPPNTDLQEQVKRLEAALKKANAEAKGHRLKADELDKLKADQEAATLSEQQKLQKERDKLQAERDQLAQSLKETKIAHAVSLQAQKLGFADPSDARLYIDESQLNEDLSNVDDLLKAVIKAKPYLAGKPATTTSGGATNPSRSQTGGDSIENLITRLQQGQLSNDEYNALPVHVRSQMRQAIQNRSNLGTRR